MNRVPRISILALTASLALVLGACGTTTTPAQQAEAAITVVATEFSFTPREVTAKVGQPIRVTFKNNGQMTHDWAVKDLDAQLVETTPTETHSTEVMGHDEIMPTVHVAELPGKSTTLTFIAEKAGRYEALCTVPGHKDAGMVGTFIVTQ